MSWITNIFQKKNSVSSPAPIMEEVFISFDSVSIKSLGFEVSEDKKQKIWEEEIFFGPYENLLPGESVKNIAANLPKAINDLKNRLEGRNFISVSLPAEQTFIENISIPKGDFAQNLLRSEMKKRIPIPFNEIMFASNKISNINTVENFLCIAIQKTIFDEYVKIFKNIGVDPYFELEVFSLARAFEADEKFRFLIYINETHTKILLCKGATAASVEIVKIGSNDLEEKIILESGVSKIDAKKIFRNIKSLQVLNSESAQFLNKLQNTFFQNLSREILSNIHKIEDYFNLENTSLLLSSNFIDDVLLDKIKIEEGENRHVYGFEMETKDDELPNRYTQCFCLAKK